jgi:DNA-binding MarR family transcriptional regulator
VEGRADRTPSAHGLEGYERSVRQKQEFCHQERRAMKNKPAYGIDSVDHALHLATVLQQEGPLRVTDAAQRLGVAPSAAHRLLAMLVYRDFAEQDVDRR